MILSQPPAIDLRPGEQLLFTGRAHEMPTLVFPGIACCLLFLMSLSSSDGLILKFIPFLENPLVARISILALLLVGYSVFYRYYRDSLLIITDQRLLIRWGLLGTETEEFSPAAVEMPSEDNVRFGVFGFSSGFGYGSLYLRIDREGSFEKIQIDDLDDPRAAIAALQAAKEAQASR